jgi:Domain of unknown function (DUF4351)
MMNLLPLYLEQIDIATQQGRAEGRSEGEKSLIVRMLTRKLGTLDPNSIDLINNLSLESLAKPLLGESNL